MSERENTTVFQKGMTYPVHKPTANALVTLNERAVHLPEFTSDITGCRVSVILTAVTLVVVGLSGRKLS
jgi:hypothetical protein